MPPALRRRSLLLIGAAWLGGCADVQVASDARENTGRSIVFGKIVLVRDGETSALRAFSTSITLGEIDATAEPQLVTEPFDANGRFAWALRPGHYLLNITLHAASGDIASLAFTVPSDGGVFYVGVVRLIGRKQFDTLGGANIRDVRIEFDHDLENDQTALAQRHPQRAGKVSVLKLEDVSTSAARQEMLRRVLNAAPVCCRRYADLHYQPLSLEGRQSFQITPQGGTFRFPEGASHFLAVTLPAMSEGYTLTLRSLVRPSGIPGSFRVFVPAGLLLDANFKPVGALDPRLLQARPATVLPPQAASITAEMPLGPEFAAARYLVLYTTDALLGARPITSTPSAIPIPGGAFPTGMGRPAPLLPWSTGQIELSLRPTP